MNETKIEKLKKKLSEKYNVAIDFIKNNNRGEIDGYQLFFDTIVATSIAIVTISGVSINNHYQEGQVEKSSVSIESQAPIDNDVYTNLNIDTNSIPSTQKYNLGDIYTVYTADDVYFCTKSLDAVNEIESNERDMIYGYYNIKNGEKVCQDHDYGFYVEKLTDFYQELYPEIKEDHEVTYDELANKINIDYLLSRQPSAKGK